MDSEDRYTVDARLRSSTDFNFLQTYIFVDILTFDLKLFFYPTYGSI